MQSSSKSIQVRALGNVLEEIRVVKGSRTALL